MSYQPYINLLGLENGQWAFVFGDYSLEVVQQEQEDLVDSGDYGEDELMIVTSGDSQERIENVIEDVNIHHRRMQAWRAAEELT